MADLLIRDVSPDLVNALDRKAAALGLSRVEFLRRTLTREAQITSGSVTEAHLASLLEILPDLSDAGIMRGAWE